MNGGYYYVHKKKNHYVTNCCSSWHYFWKTFPSGSRKYVAWWNTLRWEYLMKVADGRGKKSMYFTLCIIVFIVSFIGSVIFKLKYKPKSVRRFEVKKGDTSVGTKVTDLVYGEKLSNKFDLYFPTGEKKDSYGLVAYLHAGGFTQGDKSEDESILRWLCSKGYVAAGINYTLFSEANPDANVYTQSVEIRESIPFVIGEAKKRGYVIDQMAIAGGSAGGALALLYAYRDADTSPVPVKMVYEGVGPSSFYPEDWKCFGFDKEEGKKEALELFSTMSGNRLTEDMLGTEKYDEAIKNISALLWVNERSVPAVLAYGTYDKLQSFEASVRLDKKLTECGVDHAYIVCEHSGHGLQNDTKKYLEYLETVEKYLDRYIPVNKN